ncbi:MAG: SDR family NAD(P)-dependent oxidoreductase [Bacteroidota bacterium]
MNIFITGISSGIGNGLTKYYLNSKHRVYGVSRHKPDIPDDKGQLFFRSLDISDFEKVKADIPLLLQNIDNLDVVILNAGILPEIGDLTDTSLEELKRVMDVNLWANKVLIDILFKTVDKIRQVVAISSGASVSGSRGWNGYAISKAALNMMIKLYSREYPATHFSAFAPGLVDSKMQAYIARLEENKKFPVLEKLHDARGTDAMPSADKAAPVLAEGFALAREYESGSFIDIRKMKK